MKFNRLIKLIFIFLVVLAFNACDKVENVNTPELTITANSNTYKVGEPVLFNITGNADYIKFFSGEKGNDYSFSSLDRIVNTVGVNLSFTTEYQNGGQFSDLMRLFYSTDFDGDYSVAGINKASWTDITDRCVLPTAISNNNNPLGIANSNFNVYDLFATDESVVYFAFKYHIKGPSSTYGQRTNAIVSGFKMEYEDDEDKKGVLLEQATAPWRLIGYANYENEAASALSTNSTRILFSCAANPQVDKIAFAISPGVSVPKLVNLGPDWAKSAKDYQKPQINSFGHVFQTAGEYDVVFIASNVYAGNVKEKIYRLKLNIVD